MLSTSQKLEAVKGKIGRFSTPINLEHVMLFLKIIKDVSFQVRETGEFMMMGISTGVYWDLGHDLDWQTIHNPSVIDWLYDNLNL